MVRVRRIKMGSQGLEVPALGLGCMSMSYGYGPPKPETEMIPLIHQAINNGITFLDSSDAYGPHHNELLLGKALKGVDRSKVQLATKFGIKINADGSGEIKGDPTYVRACCEASLKRLDIDYIDLYYIHRIDKKVPIEITMGELKKLFEEGKIKYIGLSEASPETLRRAHAVHPITAVQLEWSLWTRDSELEVIPTCRELGIGIVAYSPLGQGFFTSGPDVVPTLAADHLRSILPKFKPENMEHNRKLGLRVSEMGANKGCSAPQLALAWLHHQGNDVCPIPGTTKIENLNKNMEALSVKLTPQEVADLETIADEVKGERYPDSMIKDLWKYANTPPLSLWEADKNVCL